MMRSRSENAVRAILATMLIALCAGANAVPLDNPAPAATSDATPENPVVVEPGYRLQVDDILRMTVAGEPELSDVTITVTPDGTAYVPQVGNIQAKGKTISELKQEITDSFVKRDYLRNPVIQLWLYSVHKMQVRVLGQVLRPGLQQMREGSTVDMAIAEAGGFNPDSANLHKVTITRVGEPKTIAIDLYEFYFNGDVSKNISIQEGDTIYIPEDTENRYFVTGYVQNPRMFPLKPNTTVTEAISMAGGARERGEVGKTTVIRKGRDGKPDQKIRVNVAKILSSGDLSGDVVVEPGDVILVPETSKPDLNFIGSALNIVSTWAYLSRLGVF